MYTSKIYEINIYVSTLTPASYKLENNLSWTQCSTIFVYIVVYQHRLCCSILINIHRCHEYVVNSCYIDQYKLQHINNKSDPCNYNLITRNFIQYLSKSQQFDIQQCREQPSLHTKLYDLIKNLDELIKDQHVLNRRYH